MEFVSEDGNQLNSECTTLLLPALSIGNVGQLAVDLMISTLGADRIGFLDDSSLIPCVGNDAYTPLPPGHLVLPLEAYDSASNKLTFVQQRSPVSKGMMVQFAKNLADLFVAAGKKHVIVLSSLDFGRWRKVDTSSGVQIYYLSSKNADGTDDDCEKLGWTRLQEYNPSQRRWKYLSEVAEGSNLTEEALPFDDDIEEDEDYFASLPFAAFFSCFKAKGLNVTCLLCYCSEGDNIPDSINLAEAGCKFLGLRPKTNASAAGEWVIPCSWQSLYGPPPDMSMF